MVQKKEMVALFVAAALIAISSLAHHTNAQSSGGPHPVCMKWQQECVQLQAQKKPCPPPPTCTESIGTGTCAGAICVGEKAKTQGGEEEALDKDLSKLKEAVKEAAPGGGSSGGSGSGGGQQGGQQSEPKASELVDRSVQEALDNTYDYSPSERGEPGGGKSVADEIAEYAKLPVGGSEGGATEVGGGAQSASELHPDDVGGLDTWSPSGDQGAQGGADEKNPSFAENTFGNGDAEANPEDRGPFERAFDAVRDWAGQKLEDLGDAAGKMAEDIYQEVFGEEEKATVEPQATPREAYQQAYRSCASGGGGFSECSAAGRAAYDAASTAAPVAAPPVEPLLGLGTGRQTEGLTADRSGLDSTQGGVGEPVTGWNTPRIDTNDLVEQVASDLAPSQDLSGVGQPLEELQQRLAQEAPEVPTPDAQADIQQQAPGEQGATKQEGSLRESLQKAIQDFSAGMDRFAKEVEGMREGLLMTGEKGGNREGLPTNPERLVQAAQMNPDLSITGQAGPSPRTALPGEGAQGEPGFSLIDAPADVAPIDGGNSAVGNPDLDNQLTEPSVEDVAGLPPIEQLQERLAQGAPEVPFEGGDYAPVTPIDPQRIADALRERWESLSILKEPAAWREALEDVGRYVASMGRGDTLSSERGDVVADTERFIAETDAAMALTEREIEVARRELAEAQATQGVLAGDERVQFEKYGERGPDSIPLTEPSVEDVAGLPPIEQLQERLAQGAPEVPTPTQAELDAAPKPQEQGLLDRVWEGMKDGAKSFGELVQDGLRNLADSIISPAEAQPRGLAQGTPEWWPGGSNPHLAEQRAALLSELDTNPELRKRLAAVLWGEAGFRNVEQKQPVLEAMLNRSLMRGYTSLSQAIDDGFYGPVNAGRVDAYYERGVNDGDLWAADRAVEAVKGGSNVCNYCTDQGQEGEIKGRKWEIQGEWFGHVPGGEKWAKQQVAQTAVREALVSTARITPETAALPAGFAERAVPASLNYSSPLLDTPVPGEIIGNPLSYENAAAGPSFTPSANDAVPTGLSYSPQQPTFTAIEVPAPDMSVNNPFTMSEGLRSALQEAGDSINRNFADTGRALTEYFANNPGPNNSLGESLTYQNAAREADQAARDYFSNYPGADNAFAERLNYDGVGQPIEQLQKRLAQSAPEIPFEGGDYAPTQPVDTQPIEDILRARWESARSKYADETSLPGVLADAFGLRTPPESLRLARDAEGAYTDFVSGEIMGRAAAPPVSQRNDDTARVASSDGGTQDPAADVPFVQDAAPSAPERNSAADALAEALAGEERFPSYPPYLPTDRSVERTALPEPGTPEFFEQQLADAKEARRAAEARWVENRSLAQRVGDSLGLTTSPEYTAKSAAEDAYNKAWRDSWDYVTESLQERGVLGRELASLPAYSDAANRELADSVNITNAPPSDYAPSGDPDIDNLGGAPSAEEIPLNTQPLPTPRETGQAIQTALQNALKNMWGEELSNVPAAEPELTTRPALADVPNSFTRDLGVTSERLSAVEHGQGTDRLAADYGDGSSRIDPRVDIDNLGGAPSAEDVSAALAAREPQVDTPSGSSNDPAALSRVPEWAKWSKEFADFARGAPEAVAEAVRDAVQPVWDSVARNAEALFASQKPPVFESVPDTAGAAEFERSGEGTGGGLRAEAPEREAEYDARRAAEKARETPRVAGFAQGTEPVRRPGADAANFSEWNKATGQNLTRADREQLWKQSGVGGAYRATEEQNNQLLNYVKREAGVGTTPRVGAPSLSTEAPAVGGAGGNLSQWFQSRGESLPSLSERRALYTTFYGLGTSYNGTAAQNARLLEALRVRY